MGVSIHMCCVFASVKELDQRAAGVGLVASRGIEWQYKYFNYGCGTAQFESMCMLDIT